MKSSAHNIASILKRSAAVFPGYPAIAVGTKTVRSYTQLAERVERLAAAMLYLAEPGDRILVNSPNCAEYLEILFAVWQAGMIAVPVNCKLHENEVAYIKQHCQAKAVFGIGGEPMDPVELLRHAPGRVDKPRAVTPDTPAWIFYTSGTTGKPKGATLSHGNLFAMCRAFLVDVVPVEPGDAMVHSCQLSHGSGLYALPHVLKAACNVVFDNGSFEPVAVVKAMNHWTGASTFGPATVLNRVVSAIDGEPAFGFWNEGGAKALIYGGSPLYFEDLQRARAITGGRVVQIYGQGESPCTITAMSKAMYEKANEARLASVGVPQTGIEIRIADYDDNELPVGEVGEVLVKGPTVMAGYWEAPRENEKTLRNGWLHTGDVGKVDGDGFLTLLDRSKDVVISGGHNVYPREVEEILLRHPAVSEVSVVGKPDAEWGEKIVAYVVPKAELCTSDLDKLCIENIARFKRPREYFVVSELPKSAYGKVLKTVLREVA